MPSSSFTFFGTIPNILQVHRSAANKESRLDGSRKEKSAQGLGEEEASLRIYPQQGALVETESLQVEGKAAGQKDQAGYGSTRD